MFRSLLSVGIALLSGYQTLAVNCYYPNGNLDTSGVAACSSQGGTCCPLNWECLSNGLCALPGQNYIGRYTCTDRDWGSSCPDFCTQDDTAIGNEAILQCKDGSYCCDRNRDPKYNCCDDTNAVVLPNLKDGTSYASISTIGPSSSAGAYSIRTAASSPANSPSSNPQTSSPTSKSQSQSPSSSPSQSTTTTSSGGSSSSGSSDSTSSPSSRSRQSVITSASAATNAAGVATTIMIIQTTTPSPDANADSDSSNSSAPDNHKSLAIGLGVGLGVGIPLLLLIAGFLFWRHRRNNQLPSVTPFVQEDVDKRFPPPKPAQEADGFPVAAADMKQEYSPRSELAGSETFTAPSTPAMSSVNGELSPPHHSPPGPELGPVQEEPPVPFRPGHQQPIASGAVPGGAVAPNAGQVSAELPGSSVPGFLRVIND